MKVHILTFSYWLWLNMTHFVLSYCITTYNIAQFREKERVELNVIKVHESVHLNFIPTHQIWLGFGLHVALKYQAFAYHSHLEPGKYRYIVCILFELKLKLREKLPKLKQEI